MQAHAYMQRIENKGMNEKPRQVQSPRRVPSEALFGPTRETRELVIVHNGREYRLRVTQNGKLILTA